MLNDMVIMKNAEFVTIPCKNCDIKIPYTHARTHAYIHTQKKNAVVQWNRFEQ